MGCCVGSRGQEVGKWKGNKSFFAANFVWSTKMLVISSRDLLSEITGNARDGT